MTEPARTKCLELLVEEQVTIGLRAVLPKGTKDKPAPTELKVPLPKDRRGKERWRSITPEGTRMGAGLAVRLLHMYQLNGENSRSDPETGEPLRENRQTYLEEMPLEENAGYEFIVRGYGQGMTVVSTITNEDGPPDEDFHPATEPGPARRTVPDAALSSPADVAAEAVRDGVARPGSRRRADDESTV